MVPHAIFELRRYRLKPGGREALIEIFDRAFVETQEAAGMRVLGQYRDLDDPDAFVWFRSFPDLIGRTEALAAFYGGAAWRAFGPAANAAMLNSDNVLLLKPAGGRSPFGREGERPRAEDGAAAGLVTVSVASLAPRQDEAFARVFAEAALPLLEAAGARIDAAFATERGPNGFPRLPVREGETVFAWVSAFPDEAAHRAHLAALADRPRWRDDVFPRLDAQLWRPLETARLAPTARSRHRW